MDMNANGSSFEANLTLQTSTIIRDVSFSSYLNKSEENMVRKLTNQASKLQNDHQENEEIDVFGAEKYFKDEIEDRGNKNDHPRFINTSETTTKMHQQDEKVEELDHNLINLPAKQKPDETSMHTPSVRSNASCNSRSGLLPRANQPREKIENQSKTRTKTRTFLARIGCNCINKKSTQISKPQTLILDFDQKTVSNQFSSNLAEKKARNDQFSFPVVNNSNDQNSNSSSNSKSGNLAGKVEGDHNNGGQLSVGKKLSLLNEMYNSSSRMYNKDVDSDSSSDLFEIESFSPTGDSSVVDHRRSESNCYAPSEVSVDWSVVTASAADFSVVSDYDDVRTGGGGGGWRYSGGNGRVADNKEEQRKRLGILSGCTTHKAVRVAGDEFRVSGGGAGGRQQLSGSMTVGGMFRGRVV